MMSSLGDFQLRLHKIFQFYAHDIFWDATHIIGNDVTPSIHKAVALAANTKFILSLLEKPHTISMVMLLWDQISRKGSSNNLKYSFLFFHPYMLFFDWFRAFKIVAERPLADIFLTYVIWKYSSNDIFLHPLKDNLSIPFSINLSTCASGGDRYLLALSGFVWQKH